MTATQSFKATEVAAALAASVIAGIFCNPPQVHAQDRLENSEASRIQQGLEIAPVPLYLFGKDLELVGLGSYLVNVVAGCNGCHTGGAPPNSDYAAGGNPYFGQRQRVDPTVYLSGGQDFGPAGTPTGPSMYAGPDIISRNLTPDKTGMPGGYTLVQFKQIMRSGIDFDHLHPTCTTAELNQIENSIAPLPVCIPTSPGDTVDGNLLQEMPWPTFSSMIDSDLDALYEYLSAIPCIEGPPDATNPLHNDCGTE